MSNVREAAADTRIEIPPVKGSSLPFGIVLRITSSLAEVPSPPEPEPPLFPPVLSPVLLPVVVPVCTPVVVSVVVAPVASVAPVVVPVVSVVPA